MLGSYIPTPAGLKGNAHGKWTASDCMAVPVPATRLMASRMRRCTVSLLDTAAFGGCRLAVPAGGGSWSAVGADGMEQP